ncbi:MAG: hypothetical protein CL678_18470 [Bdellovibrionaceae bacterium]|nr:hypothetical protein [Pseudobdellovibrionaceae bacterium]|tara:strand:- start:3238 stop:3630 length:393 start_codon:yes stop_codon:yes gene_type:complete
MKIPIQGKSMWPFLRDGDWVDVSLFSEKKEKTKVGNVYLFMDSEKEWIVHRKIDSSSFSGDWSCCVEKKNEVEVFGEISSFYLNDKKKKIKNGKLDYLMTFFSKKITKKGNSVFFSRGMIFILGSIKRFL